ncbi:nuclease-related domain-containing protein [Salinicoccus hispanicus]|uniref:NERD domain-containing protein n=1 Tax=Salinicoccus hispanicus TaxID=157225 RepID=A0A6N8TZK3_9STAP|nr:nuclease-related domain-containing protein [Salinicoccus hispanicus]MXQ50902.1 NERD domain-containing protein [Salinicoccus hispanicus]
MFLTEREKSQELDFHEVLERRTELGEGERKRLKMLRQGFHGEQIYDRLWDEVGHEQLLIFRDLWLKIENATLQIDALIVGEDRLIVNEIKNYSGMYQYENGSWSVNGFQISEDPLAQASRTAGKLIRLKYGSSHPFEIDRKVTFINPHFNLTIDSDENEKHIVTRSMMKYYMRDIAQQHAGPGAAALSNTIRSCIIDDPMTPPEVEAGRIRTGLYCGRCGSFGLSLEHFRTRCTRCGHSETIEYQTVQAITDFAILFPGKSITKQNIRWITGGEVSVRRMERYLNKYCTLARRGKHSAYTIDTSNLKELLKIKGYDSKYEKDKKILAD